MERVPIYIVVPWEILLLNLNGGGKTDEVCRTGDSLRGKVGPCTSGQYGEKIMELTSVPLNSPEDLIQQAKNLKASSLGS